MDIGNQIQQLKNQKLKAIEEAAKSGNVQSILLHTKAIEKLEKMQKDYGELSISLELLKQNPTSPASSDINPLISHKKRGQLKRAEFVKEAFAQGIEMIHIKGQKYKINNNGFVGIAYASERSPSPNKWFLGLPSDNSMAMVLLCDDEYNKTTTFVFSKEFYEKYKNQFSKDHFGQYKFNIALREGRYTMKLPHIDDIYINEYISKFQNLLIA